MTDYQNRAARNEAPVEEAVPGAKVAEWAGAGGSQFNKVLLLDDVASATGGPSAGIARRNLFRLRITQAVAIMPRWAVRVVYADIVVRYVEIAPSRMNVHGDANRDPKSL